MGTIFIACVHDRHTDDKYRAFWDEENAKTQCRRWMQHFPTAVENQQYGDWCLYIADDYYAFVQEVTVGVFDE